MLIFSILNYPFPFMVFHCLFGVGFFFDLSELVFSVFSLFKGNSARDQKGTKQRDWRNRHQCQLNLIVVQDQQLVEHAHPVMYTERNDKTVPGMRHNCQSLYQNIESLCFWEFPSWSWRLQNQSRWSDYWRQWQHQILQNWKEAEAYPLPSLPFPCLPLPSCIL